MGNAASLFIMEIPKIHWTAEMDEYSSSGREKNEKYAVIGRKTRDKVLQTRQTWSTMVDSALILVNFEWLKS